MATVENTLKKLHVFPTEALYEQFKSSIGDSDLALLKDESSGIVAANLAQNGYVKFSNGLILQWGYLNDTPITFPLTFLTKCYTVVPQIQTANGNNMSKNRVYITNLSRTGFDIANPEGTYVYVALGN